MTIEKLNRRFERIRFHKTYDAKLTEVQRNILVRLLKLDKESASLHYRFVGNLVRSTRLNSKYARLPSVVYSGLVCNVINGYGNTSARDRSIMRHKGQVKNITKNA